MPRKLPPLLLTYIVVATFFFLPTFLQAQSIVLITFAVIGVGQDEVAEILWRRTPKSANDNSRWNNTGDFYIRVKGRNGAFGNEACTQAMRVTVPATHGLNTLTLYRDGRAVWVNDELAIEDLDECFDQETRVVFQVGVLHPPPKMDTRSGIVEPVNPPAGFPIFVNQAVYDRITKATRAASEPIKLESGYYTVTETIPGE